MEETRELHLPWTINPKFTNQYNVQDNKSEDVMDFWYDAKNKVNSEKVNFVLKLVNNSNIILELLKSKLEEDISEELKIIIQDIINDNN